MKITENGLAERKRNLLAYMLLALGIAFISYSVLGSVNFHGQNEACLSGTHGEPVVRISPVDLTVERSSMSSVSIKITVISDENFSSLKVVIDCGESSKVLDNSSFTPRDYYVTYVSVPHGISNLSPSLEMEVNGSAFYNADLRIMPEYQGLLMESLLFTGAAFVVFFLLAVKIRRRNFLFLLPVFIGMSVLFGQRYDDYFMISSGMFVLQHVNPYIVSRNLAPSLQWEYPPGFIPWSVFSSEMYSLILQMKIPSASLLNYVGVAGGAIYSPWRSLAGTNLYFLYGIIKLPMVISFFWIASNIRKLTGQTSWKLWILNPFAIIVGVLWGQLDVLALAFMLQGIIYHRSKNDFMSMLFVCIGGAIKVFPFLMVPMLLFRSDKKWKALVGIIPVALFIVLMYEISGNFIQDISTFIVGRSVPTAFGIFYSQGLTWQLLVPLLHIRSFPSLFLYVFAPFYVVITVLSIKLRLGTETYFVILMLVFMLTYNFANPQYLIWPLAFLIIVDEKFYASAISVLGGLFMVFTYNFSYFINAQLSWNYFSSLLGEVEQLRLSITDSPVSLAVFGTISSVIFLIILILFTKDRLFKEKLTMEVIS